MKPWCCRFCKRKFATRALRNVHERRRKRSIYYKRRKMQHKKTMHNLPKLAGRDWKTMKPSLSPVWCSKCCTLFATMNLLQKHLHDECKSNT